MKPIEQLAEEHLPGPYTIERREFMDGDTREVAIHSRGLGELGDRYDFVLWRKLGYYWIEYYEGDVLRDRAEYRYRLTDRIA